MDGQPQLGLGVFAMDEDIMAGGARPSANPKASGKKKNDDDDANYTTVMLRNIPNKYTRQMLIDQLHRGGFRGHIDYLYLPTDFANRCNVGYCFVNFRDAPARARFVGAFDGVAAQSCLPGFNSYKVCQVTRAKWQGREDNVRRLKSSPELMAQLAAHTEWLPLLLDTEGNQEPFLCDESISAARGPAAPRRQMRKKNNQGMMAYPGMPGMQDMAAWEAAMHGFPMDDMGAGMAGPMGVGAFAMGGRGRGGGDRGKRRGRGGGGGAMQSYQDMAAGASYAGVPAMMSVPVMTEQGLQYIPYDAYEGGYFLAYSPMSPDVYGMMPSYGAGYPGAGWNWEGGGGAGFGDPYGAAASGVWPMPVKGKGRGRRRGGAAPATVEAEGYPVTQEDDDDDE